MGLGAQRNAQTRGTITSLRLPLCPFVAEPSVTLASGSWWRVFCLIIIPFPERHVHGTTRRLQSGLLASHHAFEVYSYRSAQTRSLPSIPWMHWLCTCAFFCFVLIWRAFVVVFPQIPCCRFWVTLHRANLHVCTGSLCECKLSPPSLTARPCLTSPSPAFGLISFVKYCFHRCICPNLHFPNDELHWALFYTPVWHSRDRKSVV